ncbi:hypothetical protein BDCR2A_00473 [Borrelia duttonii CR2A]|uniref:Uncharacterized protein n=1 Tax=Borrelia duttonii CR2A TaxID=1432657 RepID=W6TIK2_9SPIR|nr:hypothetical protein BDCR2A_00473 [Borrelia duttonii CR2A]
MIYINDKKMQYQIYIYKKSSKIYYTINCDFANSKRNNI